MDPAPDMKSIRADTTLDLSQIADWDVLHYSDLALFLPSPRASHRQTLWANLHYSSSTDQLNRGAQVIPDGYQFRPEFSHDKGLWYRWYNVFQARQ